MSRFSASVSKIMLFGTATFLVFTALATWLSAVSADSSPQQRRAISQSKINKEKIEKLRDHFSPLTLAVPQPARITFNDQDRTNCYYRNQFFNKDVRASFELVDTPAGLSASISPPLIGRFAEYFVPPPSQPGNYFIETTCDGHIYDTPVNVPSPAGFIAPDIQLPNAPPLIISLSAKHGGQVVNGVPAGSTVSLTAVVSDPDNDSLSYLWAANEGQIVSVNAPTTKWKLPNAPGLHFAYVLVTDGKGGYREASISLSTDGGVVPAPPQPSVTPLPSDKVPLGDHFLTFFSTKDRLVYPKGADSRMGSCQYYLAIQAVEGCNTDGSLVKPKVNFANWKAKWGFRNATPGFHAKYANAADLNLQRDMHGIANASGTAYYVCNYPNPPTDPNLTNVINGKKLVACVGMEYSVTPGENGNQPFTKFLVFGPGGELFQSVNLDTRGEKFLPGACIVCHGADATFNRYAENGSSAPNLKAQFIPFDLDNFKFSTKPGFTRHDQEKALRDLNELVLTTNPNPAIQELIGGWYVTPTSSFDGSFVPPGWSAGGHDQLYKAVVKPSCRMCHIAMSPTSLDGDPNRALSFQKFEQFQSFNFEVGARVCGNSNGVERKRYSMPNARTTFDRFWTSVGGIPNVVQPKALLDYLKAEGEFQASDTCDPPN